ncbi:MAG: DUF930 domain-containing protein [Roseibium sp.]|nr:DUF930 domain-containing protein [Roseibium sp.]
MASDPDQILAQVAADRPAKTAGAADSPFLTGGLFVSVLLHVFAAGLLIGGVELPRPDPPEPAPAIEVALVPAPEAEPPEPEPVAPEPEPETPGDVEPQQDPEPETPGDVEPQQDPEPEEPNPAEEEPPLPDEAAATEDLAAAPLETLPVLQPVVEYGETDTGPEIALDGAAAEEPETTEPPVPTVPAEDPEPAEPVTDETGETGESETTDLETADAERPSEEAVEPVEDSLDEAPETTGTEIAGLAEMDVAPDVESELTEDTDLPSPVVAVPVPAAKPRRDPAAESGGRPETLIVARRLYSTAVTDDPLARTAIAGVPRQDRANLLCMTELRGQLENANPPRPPEALPTFQMTRGTVLEPRQAAFRSGGLWYDLAFRCELDDRITRVLAFQYRVGDPVPRDEWQQRGFPNF